MHITNTYYRLKPFMPRWIQILIRRQMARFKLWQNKGTWPIDTNAGSPPPGWRGWPDNKEFALILKHDVDTQRGFSRSYKLAQIEKQLGFRSVFNFVPEKYNVSSELRRRLVDEGFEVGVHGLRHDGRLFASRRVFTERAVRINHYINEWKAAGFNSPFMIRNLDWIHDLNIEYDQSTFDVDPFEPQSDGAKTIFPFWVSKNSTTSGFLELPYTLAQDFTVFVILQKKSLKIWEEKLDWIVTKGGMALLNTHPCYMAMDGERPTLEEYPVEYYINFLEHIKERYSGRYYHVLPKEMAHFWRQEVLTR